MKMFPVMKGNACVKGRSRVIAIINSKGKIDLVSYKDKKEFFGVNIPFLRGFTMLFFGLYIFFISLNRAESIGKERKQDEKYIEEKNENVNVMQNQNINEIKSKDNKEELRKRDKISKINKTNIKTSKNVELLNILGVLGVIVSVCGLIILPYILLNILIKSGVGIWLSSFIIAIIRLALFIFTLLFLKIIPSIRQFYRNNSAGNLAVSDFYNKKIDSYHLSTNFLNYLVCGFFVSLFVVSFILVDVNFFLRLLINSLVIMICFSVTYEILKLLEFKNGTFSRLLIMPLSYWMNEKPTQTEREIAFTALNEVILMQGNEERLIGKTKDTEIVFSVMYTEVKNRLNDVGITDIAEIDWLIAECLNKSRNDIKLLTHIGREDYKKIKNALIKREKRMPLSKIFNRVNFYGYDLYVDKKVLSPRQETEEVVEEAIKLIKKTDNKKIKVLDLMTGSGAIAIALAKETDAQVFASDISEQALEIAKKNAKKNKAKVVFVESDIFKGIKKEKFDLIISNPPYIPSQEILTLDDEVKKYDPLIALDGGKDGLFFYREIADKSPGFLKSEGTLILEIGENQSKEVKKLLQKNFENIKIKKDYSKNDRMVIAVLKETYDNKNSSNTKKI